MQEPLHRDVTIVTSDLKGSTRLGERLDAESLREVLTLYFDSMRAIVEAHGGTIEKIIGDAIVAVFGGSGARTDDAVRAVQAASEMQAAIVELNEHLHARWGVRLEVRTGIASGEAVLGGASVDEHILTGEVVARATRLEQASPTAGVLLDAETVARVGASATVEPFEVAPPEGGVAHGGAAHGGAAMGDAVHLLVSATPADELATAGGHARALDGVVDAGGAPVITDTRKTVTIVFTDLRATNRAGEPLSAERQRDVMARAFEVARRVLSAHGGTVEKFIGDAVMAVFGLPVRHEDDGLRAVRAALEMTAGLSALSDALAADEAIRLRIATGVNTGEVVAGDASLGQRLVTGDAVNVAARLEQKAPDRGVYLGELTYGLVRDAVDVEAVEPLILKGKSQPVAAYHLLSVGRGETFARRQDTPMVGREAEMALLRGALTAATIGRDCRMVTVVGDAGVGKTRLTREFLDSVQRHARVLRGRCLPYGDGITFWPVAEVVRQAADIREDDPPEAARRRLATLLGPGTDDIVDRVATAIGLQSAPFQIAELFWGIRRFLEVLAQDEPVVVLFDDIHWAEATFLDLVEHLMDGTADAPLVVMCTTRHELLDERPDWAQREREARIVLMPLTAADAEAVIDNLLGRAGLATDVRAAIVGAAEGNPLFVEQLLSMLIDRGTLRYEDGAWVATGTVSGIDIPPTIHALLAARLDQLPMVERTVIEPASVIGLNFASAALQELVPEPLAPELGAHLGELSRRQLVRLAESAVTDATYRFAHILVRDAAYQGLLKRSRVTLHERFVDWADRVNAEAGRATEFDEILGYHLEQAYRYRTELGPLDAAGVATGIRASGRLGSAGQRAFGRGDMPAATNLLGRASDLIPDEDLTRPLLLLRLGEAKMEMGDYEGADSALAVAMDVAARQHEAGTEARARLTRLMFRFLTGRAEGESDVEGQIRDAIAAMELAGDHDGLAMAWRFVTNLRIGEGRWAATEDAVGRWIESAQAAGDRVSEIRAGPTLAMAALFGPLPVPAAIVRCEELLTRTGGDRRSEALIRRSLARLHAMRGEFEVARDLYRGARRALDELGWTFQATLTSLDAGPIEVLAGDYDAAIAELQGDFDTLDRLGERNFISTVAASLAVALVEAGRYDEAEAKASFAAEVAAPDDSITQILWRGARARLLARDGRVDEARVLAQEAVDLSMESDDPVAQADALYDFAEVVSSADPVAARAALEAAQRLYEAKGNLVSAADAAAQLLQDARRGV